MPSSTGEHRAEILHGFVKLFWRQSAYFVLFEPWLRLLFDQTVAVWIVPFRMCVIDAAWVSVSSTQVLGSCQLRTFCMGQACEYSWKFPSWVGVGKFIHLSQELNLADNKQYFQTKSERS
jgi:hypothetical protein